MANEAGNSNPAGIDVSQFMGALTQLGSTLQNSMLDLKQTESDLAASSASGQTAIMAGAEAQQAINLADFKKQEKINRDNFAAAAALGSNPNAESYIIAAMGQQLLADAQDVSQRNAKLQERYDTGLLDDPLQFLVNQFVIPFEEDALNNRLSSFNQKNGMLKEVMARTTEAFAVNAGIEAGASEEKLMAVNALVAAKANKDVADSRTQLARWGLDSINIRRAINKDTFDLTVAANNFQVQLWDMGLKQEKFLMDKEQFASEKEYKAELEKHRLREAEMAEERLALAKETLELQRNAAEGKKEARDALQAKLNNFTDVTGLSRITLDEFKLMSGPMKAAIESGMMDPNVQNGRLGFDAADSLEKANLINAPLTPGMNILRSKMIGIKTGVANANAMSATPWASMKEADRNALVQTAIKDSLVKENKNIPDQGGFFSPPPLSQVLNMNPVISELSLAKAMAPLANTDPQYATKADDMFKIAINKINKGEATPAQMAAEISTIYKAIMVDNNTQRQYNRFALPGMSEQSGFNTQVYTGYGWNAVRVVNMASAAQLETILTRRAMEDLTRARFQQETGLAGGN